MVDLSAYNTLRLPAKAKNLIEIKSETDVQNLPRENIVFLGEGANILFRTPQLDTIVKVNLKGKKIISESDSSVLIEIAAGESWHDFVTWTVDYNWSGVENMAYIPGTVGAAPIGNIGAYGQSVDQILDSIRFLNLETGKVDSLPVSRCRLAYRNSIFKQELKNKILVLSATFRLSKLANSRTDYYSRHESLMSEIAKFASEPYTVKDVYRAVINLRTQKLPDWKTIGTAGSIFKNPFVTQKQLKNLQKQIPDIQYYPTTGMDYPRLTDPGLSASDYVKIPAGRLLDELGWRGKHKGNIGTFEKHALIVITYPGATGEEVYEFTENMRTDVRKNFSLDLEYEVVIL